MTITAPSLRSLSWRQLLRGLTVIATLLVVGWVMEHIGFHHLLDTGWVDGEVRGHGLMGFGLFAVLGVIAIACGLPQLAFAFVAGYVAGFVAGAALGLAVTWVGSTITFLYARLIAREAVRQRLGPRARRVDDFLGRNPFVTTMMIRFLPVGSNVLTNLVAGVSAVPAPSFLLGSIIGFLPQSIVFALLGSGVRVNPPLRIGLAVVLFIASAALGALLYRRFRGEHDIASTHAAEARPVPPAS